MEKDTSIDGVVHRHISNLKVGDRVDLSGDGIADPTFPEYSDHPEFEFDFEVVAVIERESEDCIRVDFESGFSCGFPSDHVFVVDGEQVR